MNECDLLALGLSPDAAAGALALFEQALSVEQQKADEAFAQLSDQTARLEAMQAREQLLAQLAASGARDPALLLQLVDMPSLKKTDSGLYDGLDAQLAALKKRSPYLFGDAPSPRGGAEIRHAPAKRQTMNGWLRGKRG